MVLNATAHTIKTGKVKFSITCAKQYHFIIFVASCQQLSIFFYYFLTNTYLSRSFADNLSSTFKIILLKTSITSSSLKVLSADANVSE